MKFEKNATIIASFLVSAIGGIIIYRVADLLPFHALTDRALGLVGLFEWGFFVGRLSRRFREFD